MSQQTRPNEGPEHECPICESAITIKDAFTHERCPGCESSLQEMQRAANE